MRFIESSFFKKYLLPGFIFQSVVIGGGYGTGREIIEYFLMFGPLGGLLSMIIVTTVMWSLILMVTFEFARIFKAYDYRSFFKILLGRYWFIFEVLYMIDMLIVLAVIGSAAGVLLRDNLGVPYLAGVVIILISIGFLTFKGSGLIEKFLASWSIFLYVIYGVIFIVVLFKFFPLIQRNFATLEILPGWILGGFKYALYNLAVIPAVLFCLNHIESRKESIYAGLLGGVIGIFPGVLFFIAVTCQYPSVLPEEIPMINMLNKIGSAFLLVVFQIMLFGTLIETGTGFIHSFNERIQSVYHTRGKAFPRRLRPLIALVLLLLGFGISTFGLIDLIAKGYGSLSWGVLFVFVVPLFTIGIYKIIKKQ